MSHIFHTHQSFISNASSPSIEVRKSYEALKYWNPKLNALVKSKIDWAMNRAEQQTTAFSAELLERKPLYGIPCSIKECFEWKGMPHTSGLKSRVGVTGQDAITVQRLLDAGAIPIGSTNLSEALYVDGVLQHGVWEKQQPI